ncbi:MAG TPA: hypothetical protein VFA65_24655 [Bryobacteraceae bacterium]|nr:hypothetical protein [Bryobacteraceae bacterium]
MRTIQASGRPGSVSCGVADPTKEGEGMSSIARAIYLASQADDVGRAAWLYNLEEIAETIADFLEREKNFDRRKFIDECGLRSGSQS